jgi:hypothetical protein
MSALISRDPFARTEIHRSVENPAPGRTCDWCGGTRHNGSLFTYWTETDGGRKHPHRGLFCSKICHDSYND